MKKTTFTAILFGLSLFSLQANADTPAAKINGKNINVSDVLEEMKGLNLGNDVPQDKVFGMIRDRLVELRLILDEAVVQKLEENPEVKKALEKFKERLLIQAFMSHTVKKNVTDKAVEEALKTFPAQKQVKLSQIVVKDEKTANAVIKALENGGNFSKIAGDKSIEKETAKKGGELGVVVEAQLPEPFRAAVKNVEAGSFSKKPLQTERGFHIIKVDKRDDAGPEAIKPLARQKLEQEAVMKALKDLKEAAKIELFDQEGKPSKEIKKEDLLAAPNK